MLFARSLSEQVSANSSVVNTQFGAEAIFSDFESLKWILNSLISSAFCYQPFLLEFMFQDDSPLTVIDLKLIDFIRFDLLSFDLT